MTALFYACQSQETISPISIGEINNEIWIPFKEAYSTNNVSQYNDIHSDDILRVTKWGIRQGDDYKKKNIENFSKKQDSKRKIDFRFEHRIHEKDLAYEVGYYKLDYFEQNKITQTHYGRFHVVIKKIDGHWKITQDWDSSDINGHEVGAEDYDKLPSVAFD